MSTPRFNVQSLALPVPIDDEALARHLVERVRYNLAKNGSAPGVAVAVLPGRADLFPLAQVGENWREFSYFLASLSRAEIQGDPPVAAVGVMGRFSGTAPTGTPLDTAMVFLEWSDCRWWHWQMALTPGGRATDSESWFSAQDGDSLPPGLGRWWSLGRRRQFGLRLERAIPLLREAPGVH